MARAVLVARLLLGLALVFFGLNQVFVFVAPPENAFPPEAMAFLGALEGAVYFQPLKVFVEVLAGVLFLTGLFVPLALVLFAPILVNIVGFHLFLDDPANGVVGYVMLALELFLAWAYAPAFRGVLAARGAMRGRGSSPTCS